MLKAFATLNDIASKSLEDQLVDLAERTNSATDATLHVPSEYLELVAVMAR